jgi:hypothetical protein
MNIALFTQSEFGPHCSVSGLPVFVSEPFADLVYRRFGFRLLPSLAHWLHARLLTNSRWQLCSPYSIAEPIPQAVTRNPPHDEANWYSRLS